jgi:sarcosine oxidase delta subunit
MAEHRSRVFRRCPLCESVRPAAEFRRADERPVFGALQLTRCPVCGHIGPLQEFRRAEQPAERERVEVND